MAKSYEQALDESTRIIQDASEEFGAGLYMLSSFGADAALSVDVLDRSGVEIPIVTINTGFWFPETHAFKEHLEERYGFTAITKGPDYDTVIDVTKRELWKTDKDEYHRLTRLEPLAKAIADLGITALISGVRREQTANRTGLQVHGSGNDGETRVHPVIGWSEARVADYFSDNALPRHPLYLEGYESIGDWTTTRPGAGRTGRDLGSASECGLHILPNGTLIRAAGSLAVA